MARLLLLCIGLLLVSCGGNNLDDIISSNAPSLYNLNSSLGELPQLIDISEINAEVLYDIPVNFTAGGTIVNISSYDAYDTGDKANNNIIYEIENNPDDLFEFANNGTKGELRLKRKVRTEDAGTRNLVIVIKDSKGIRSRVRINLTIAHNQAPIFTTFGNSGRFSGSFSSNPRPVYTFAEIPFGSPQGYVLGGVLAKDPDNKNKNIRFSLSAGIAKQARALFKVNSKSGLISLRQAIDDDYFAGDYIFVVIAKDGQGGSSEADIRVSINFNKQPVFEGLHNKSFRSKRGVFIPSAGYTFANVPFNAPPDYRVGSVAARDPDSKGRNKDIRFGLSSSVSDSIRELFYVDARNGDIRLLRAVNNDNMAGNYTFAVTVSDARGGTSDAQVRFSINYNQNPIFSDLVDDSPAIPYLESFIATPIPIYTFANVPFNSPQGYTVGSVAAKDPNNNDNDLRFALASSVSSETRALFNIDAVSGRISLRKDIGNNYAGAYRFAINVIDGQGGSSDAQVMFSIDLNEQPVFNELSDDSPAIPYLESFTATPSPVYTFADIPFNSPQGYIVGGVAANSPAGNTQGVTFGLADSVSEEVRSLFDVDILSGEINLTKAVDNEDLEGTHRFMVVARYGQNGIAEAQVRVTIAMNANPVFNNLADDSPYIPYLRSFVANPNPVYTFADVPFYSPGGYIVGGVSASDPDGNDEGIRFSLSSSVSELIRSLFDVDTTSGEISLLKFIGHNQLSGSHSFIINASDGQGGNSEARVNIAVDLTQPPIFEPFGEYNIFSASFTSGFNPTYVFPPIYFESPQGSIVGHIVAKDPDGDDNDIRFSLAASNSEQIRSLFQINSESGEISLLRKFTNDDQPNVYTLIIEAVDGQGGISLGYARLTLDARPAGDIDGDGISNGLDIDDDGDGLIEIATAEDLNNIRYNSVGSSLKVSESHVGTTLGCGNGSSIVVCNGYELVSNIDLSAYENWLPIGCSGSPICSDIVGYTGKFDGNNRVISNLRIDAGNLYANVGLFGKASSGAVIQNLYINRANVAGATGKTGALIGFVDDNTIIRNAHVFDSTISLSDGVDGGGLVGSMFSSQIICRSVRSSIIIGESYNTGGLLGYSRSNVVSFSYVYNSTITGRTSIGGLLGDGHGSVIRSSYTSGLTIPSSYDNIGGLVGWGDLTITSSYVNDASIVGNDNIGGLVGYSPAGNIKSSYAAALDIRGANSVGGLIGYGPNAVVASSYVTGIVVTKVIDDGHSFAPLVGYSDTTLVTNSYWDSNTWIPNIGRGVPKSNTELKTPTDFGGSIYSAWANLWCNPDTGELITGINSPYAVESNRIWNLGDSSQFPVLGCTPRGPRGTPAIEFQRESF